MLTFRPFNRARERVRRNFAEREQLKRTRDARLAAREDEEVMKRDEDRRANPSYRQHEEQFHLKQVGIADIREMSCIGSASIEDSHRTRTGKADRLACHLCSLRR